MKRVPVPPVAAGVLLLDQATKFAVIRRLPLHDSVPLTPFFSLTHVENTGAAFGMFPGGNLFFIATSVGVLGALAFLHRRLAQSGWAAWGLALLWGGALGNLLDRLLRGRVTDFLDFFWRGWHWPAFNAADSAICVGVACLFIDGLVPRPEAPAAPPADAAR